MSKDTLIEMAKDVPTVSLAGLTLLGVNLQDWVVILGLAYGGWRLGVAVVEFVWKLQDRKAAKEKANGGK